MKKPVKKVAKKVPYEEGKWAHVFARILLGIVPLSWSFSEGVRNYVEHMKGDGAAQVLDFNLLAQMLASPELWIGVVAGAALLVGAVYYRRKREQAD